MCVHKSTSQIRNKKNNNICHSYIKTTANLSTLFQKHIMCIEIEKYISNHHNSYSSSLTPTRKYPLNIPSSSFKSISDRLVCLIETIAQRAIVGWLAHVCVVSGTLNTMYVLHPASFFKHPPKNSPSYLFIFSNIECLYMLYKPYQLVQRQQPKQSLK